jgi:hypothetical protein
MARVSARFLKLFASRRSRPNQERCARPRSGAVAQRSPSRFVAPPLDRQVRPGHLCHCRDYLPRGLVTIGPDGLGVVDISRSASSATASMRSCYGSTSSSHAMTATARNSSPFCCTSPAHAPATTFNDRRRPASEFLGDLTASSKSAAFRTPNRYGMVQGSLLAGTGEVERDRRTCARSLLSLLNKVSGARGIGSRSPRSLVLQF